MNFDLSNTRDWYIPGGDGVQLSALKVVDGLGRVIWKKYYLVKYDNNIAGTQYWTIRYYANGGYGSMTATTVDKGAAVALRTNAFARSGYSFSGWNTKPAGGGSSYSDGQTVTPGSDWALYAQWVAAGHTVSFYANGGTGSMPPINASYNSWVDIPECGFTRTGYAFSEWACEIDGEYTVYPDQDQFLMPDGDVVLSAQWTQATNQYTVTVAPGTGGTGGAGFTYEMQYSQQTKTITPPTRTGYKITGWTFTGYFGPLPSVSGSTVTIPAGTYGNFTMTPTWSEDYITITFDSNGGS